jgi:hypothetical protein
MTTDTPVKPICLPPAPINGGKLETAPPKVGNWAWQPKIDDWRGIVHTPSLTVWNQYGEISSVAERGKLGNVLGMLALAADVPEWLDIGIMQNRHDMMRGSIIVLDVINHLPFLDRRAYAESLFPLLPWATVIVGRQELRNNRVYLIPEVVGEQPGRELYEQLKIENNLLGAKFYEGVVCKKLDSLYPFHQRPKTQASGWIKHRFDQ